ncbi:uncharacterized protein BX663DRAFT_563531 [Cokeromyces recurvatus]|uniref:uncharacterized protein n=1 Tax=Cokeromyces recurvatus TaxID=90255 RepID=UPI0022204121|nr:uncharacterized protein BX663DRAFT_563531 [Cokeromyces recurvatus]KAI7899815.1 hypothetical protein BX663DRAFT_563531 [Cokeromyces recurvatus]
MSRKPIYPEVEHLIFLEKRAKLEKVNSESKKDNSTTQNPKRTSKRSAKRSRQTNTSAASSSKMIRGSSDDVGPILQDYKDTKREISAEQNLDMVQLTSSFVELSATLNGSLFVPENRLKNYGQFLPTACETIATTYNNYYVENFENIICNYFIYTLRAKYPAHTPQNDKSDLIKSLLPRRFSLFPNFGLHWRFIKMDAQNLTGILPDAKQKKQANESSPFDHKQRYFYQICEKLQALPERKGKMFLNGLYTDGYTYRVLFARKVLPLLPEDTICLELNDFTSEEVDKHFRPCTVDPGRRDPFVSYHGGTDIRRLSSIEYYNMGGSVRRMKEQQKRKQRLGIEKIETNIPSPKTVSVEQFVLYITYMLQHMNTLLNFYGFETSKIK